MRRTRESRRPRWVVREIPNCYRNPHVLILRVRWDNSVKVEDGGRGWGGGAISLCQQDERCSGQILCALFHFKSVCLEISHKGIDQ